MTRTSYSILILGSILFAFSIVNLFSSELFTPTLQRAEVLACLSSIVIIGISTIWIRIEPKKTNKVNLKGKQGLYINQNLSKLCINEIGWGSHLILTATAASTLLIYWKGKIILKRGLISENEFVPGVVSNKALKEQKLTVLSNTNNYPQTEEFNLIVRDLPSILIYPLNKNSLLIVGGWSTRCFTSSDELWITGWGQKISQMLETNYN
tara:strand:+ start:104 stop:730 length:627 start_codon:yes stop_codon:yes gene_type:complete